MAEGGKPETAGVVSGFSFAMRVRWVKRSATQQTLRRRAAFERLGLKQMLLQPDFLAALEADVHLVADLPGST